MSSETHAPTFQSSGVPRDRRGRISVKKKSLSETGHGYASASGELDDNLSLPPSSPTRAAVTAFGTANSRTGYHESDGSGALRRYHHLAEEDDYFADGGGSTPRGRFSAERQRERSQSGHDPSDEYSDDEPPEPPARTRTNGYHQQNVVDYRNAAVFEDGDDGMADDRERNESLDSDWDRAQAVVERMVGMRSRSPAHGSEEFGIGGPPTHSVSSQSFRRRRMT